MGPIGTHYDNSSRRRQETLLPADDRHTPAGSEGARGDFEGWGGLLALELGGADQLQNLAYGALLKALGYDFLGRLALLDMQLENPVEQLVRREAVLVGLVGAQLGGRGLGENGLR